MGNLAAWAQTNPDQVKNLEQSLGLPPDGTWDPELAKKIESYQLMLNQTPGQTSDTDNGKEYSNLIQTIQARGAAMQPGGDSLPMQDSTFQMFLRNAGASEADLLSVIQERTLQSAREINRHAQGIKADIADQEAAFGLKDQNLNQTEQQGVQKIGQDYSNRGLVGASAQGNEVGQFQQDVGNQRASLAGDKAATIGKLTTNNLDYAAGNRDALAAANRGTQSDIFSLYRKRADEELKARDRLGVASAKGNYPT